MVMNFISSGEHSPAREGGDRNSEEITKTCMFHHEGDVNFPDGGKYVGPKSCIVNVESLSNIRPVFSKSSRRPASKGDSSLDGTKGSGDGIRLKVPPGKPVSPLLSIITINEESSGEFLFMSTATTRIAHGNPSGEGGVSISQGIKIEEAEGGIVLSGGWEGGGGVSILLFKFKFSTFEKVETMVSCLFEMDGSIITELVVGFFDWMVLWVGGLASMTINIEMGGKINKKNE